MSESNTKIAALVGIIFLFYLFFKMQGALIRRIAVHISTGIVFWLVRLVMAILTGYSVYFLIIMIGSLGRIASISDFFTLLGARPSQVGGPGLLGVALGVIFAYYAYHNWSGFSRPVQGRTVYFETVRTRTTVIGVLRNFIQKIR